VFRCVLSLPAIACLHGTKTNERLRPSQNRIYNSHLFALLRVMFCKFFASFLQVFCEFFASF
jgi:hypothetical protein